jgi:hypothetical protein
VSLGFSHPAILNTEQRSTIANSNAAINPAEPAARVRRAYRCADYGARFVGWAKALSSAVPTIANRDIYVLIVGTAQSRLCPPLDYGAVVHRCSNTLSFSSSWPGFVPAIHVFLV